MSSSTRSKKIRRTDLLLPGARTTCSSELARDKESAIVFLFGHGPQLDM